MIWWGVQGQGDGAKRWAWEPNVSQRCWLLRIPLSSSHLWITNLCNFWIYLPAKIYYERPWRCCAYKTGRLLSPLKHHFTGARNTPHFSRPNKCLDWIIFKMYTIAANTTRCSPHVPANTFVQKRGSSYFQNINFWLLEWQFLLIPWCGLLLCVSRSKEQRPTIVQPYGLGCIISAPYHIKCTGIVNNRSYWNLFPAPAQLGRQ